MKKPNFLLSVVTGVGITVGMLGCSNDGEVVVEGANPSAIVEIPNRMVPAYAPAIGSIPLPNDLLFGGTQDLTLEIPSADSTDFSDPAAALGTLDGWSAVAPFSISFTSRDGDLAIDAASVVGGSNVHLYKVTVARPEVAPGIIAPTGPVTAVERELTANLEYVVQATSATSIAIIPTVPFEQQASYMVVLTNGLQDSDGLSLLTDTQYGVAKSTVPIDCTNSDPAAQTSCEDSGIEGLEPVRQLVNAMENAAAAFDGGPARSEIIMSYQFTVQSIGAVIRAAKGFYIDFPISVGAFPQTSFSSLFTDTGPFTGIGNADLYKGQLTLNYFLGAPSEVNPLAPLNTSFLTAEMVPDGQGGLVGNPNPLGNLSYGNPLPQVNGSETVPLLVSMPKEDVCPKPVGGYPVTIFQHGITTDRTALIPIADALANAPSCRAAVSMDLPLHGIATDNAVHQGLLAASGGLVGLFEGYVSGALRERTFGVDYVNNETGAPGADDVVDTSGRHTINLSNLLVARDNNRQAILDLLYLEQALAFMDIDNDATPDFDVSNVGFIGHSLGGIVGTGLVAYSGTIAAEPVPVIKSAALANPGGGIAQMLLASPTFSPTIRAGLAGAFGAAEGTPEFEASLASFLFAAQAILDASDPVNTAAHAVTNNVPVLLMQNLDDDVISNSVATAPLSGTEPLARALALPTLAAEIAGPVAGSRFFSKLNVGSHSSLLVPDVATAEMQTQVVSFLASGGTAVEVTDPTLLAD